MYLSPELASSVGDELFHLGRIVLERHCLRHDEVVQSLHFFVDPLLDCAERFGLPSKRGGHSVALKISSVVVDLGLNLLVGFTYTMHYFLLLLFLNKHEKLFGFFIYIL